ncbi:MAG: HIRAN domain-containing protein, partial [Clostridium sp.]
YYIQTIDTVRKIESVVTDETVTRIFFMAGVRYYLNCNGENCSESVPLTRGDEVFLRSQPENKYDPYAVEMLDMSEKVLGYIPRYYSKSVTELLRQGTKISCHIYNVDKSKNCNECVKVIMEIGRI